MTSLCKAFKPQSAFSQLNLYLKLKLYLHILQSIYFLIPSALLSIKVCKVSSYTRNCFPFYQRVDLFTSATQICMHHSEAEVGLFTTLGRIRLDKDQRP